MEAITPNQKKEGKSMRSEHLWPMVPAALTLIIGFFIVGYQGKTAMELFAAQAVWLSWVWPLLLLGTFIGAVKGDYKGPAVAALLTVAVLVMIESWFALAMVQLLKHGVILP